MYKVCNFPVIDVVSDENFIMQSYKVQCLWFHMRARADKDMLVRDTYMLTSVLQCDKTDLDTLEMNGFVDNVTE